MHVLVACVVGWALGPECQVKRPITHTGAGGRQDPPWCAGSSPLQLILVPLLFLQTPGSWPDTATRKRHTEDHVLGLNPQAKPFETMPWSISS